MRPEDKDKVLQIARAFLSGEELTRFAEELDKLEEERDLSIEELIDKISELIALITSKRLFKDDRELERLSYLITKASVKLLIGPKLMEIFVAQQVRRVEQW